ncbi:MAG TPA: hypothetical protein VGC87_20695 [Pyrinomonadaceae bacterium]|jgi:hypothetical protein
MDLFRDILDKQIIDHDQRPMGKVDGLVLEFTDEGPPRVAYVEVGVLTQARRLHPRLGRWVARWLKKRGLETDESFRIPWAKLVPMSNALAAAVDAEETPVMSLERWVRRHIVGRIPGA